MRAFVKTPIRNCALIKLALLCVLGYPLTFAHSATAQTALGIDSGIGFGATLASLNSGFYAQGAAITNVASNPSVNQTGYGTWVRTGAGTIVTDVARTANFTSAFSSNSSTANQKTSIHYAGVQAGADIGSFNIGSSGFSLVYGVTGGAVFLSSHANPGSTLNSTTILNIPFVGAYTTISKGGFVAELAYRHDFYGAKVNQSLTGVVKIPETTIGPISGDIDTALMSLSYKYNMISNIFIEPSGSFFLSHVNGVTVLTPATVSAPLFPGGPAATTPSGSNTTNAFDSDLGRLGARLGFDTSIYDINIQPFIGASVFHEFAGDTTGSYSFTGAPAFASTTYVSNKRVGTYGQYSAGISAVAVKSLIAFARGDIRSGDHLYGTSFTAGFRYFF